MLPLEGLEWVGSETDEWYTPPGIFTALRIAFDLDPAAPPGGVPWVPAIEHYSTIDDGLTRPWKGSVWLNPPYSDPNPWVIRFVEHGNGIALLAADTSTALWHEHVSKGDVFCFLRGRTRFIAPDMKVMDYARFASVLVGMGECVDAVASCGLGWVSCSY